MSHPLILGADPGGPRHFLAGQRVPCGTGLELELADGRWAWCRYEARLVEAIAVTIYLQLPAGSVPVPHDERMRFRWPARS